MQTQNRRRFLQGAIATAAASVMACDKPVPDSALQRGELRALPKIAGFKGRVIQKTDSNYEKWRSGMVWQTLKPERFPSMILRPESDKDVATAVRFASAEGLQLSARSGGHHVWGASLRENGLLLDLSRFKQLKVQNTGGTASVGPALWASDLMTGLIKYDQGFPVAHCATVPLGGYALGGGLGLNGDEWGGMACNNIIGGKLVTADGEVLIVDEDRHTDMLWALRGGGGAIPGVLTEFRLKTFDRPANVFSATYVFPLGLLDTALDLLDGIVDLAPRNTELLALMTHNPQAPADAPAEMKKAVAVRVQVYVDDLASANTTLDAIAAMPAVKQSVFSLPAMTESFEQLFSGSMDWRRGFGFGRFAVENAWCNDRRAAVKAIAKVYTNAPSWKSHIVIQPKLAKAIDGHGAFSVAADTYVGVYGVWDDADNNSANLNWLREVSQTLDAHANGHYINEIDAFTDASRAKKCFSEAAWQQLQHLREKWDPNDVFSDFPGQASG